MKTIFRQEFLSSDFSLPFKFELLSPPSSPSAFSYELHTGHHNCINLSWVSSGFELTAFKISIDPVPDPVFVDGSQRRTSICHLLVENSMYVAFISSIANSGESPAAELHIRYFMKPQLNFSSDPFGLLPTEPPLQAVIFNFPVGLNSSSPGFDVSLRRTHAPSINSSALSVHVYAAQEHGEPTVISFRMPQLPDLCGSSGCTSYEVDLCFAAPGGLSVCSSVSIRSVSTAAIFQRRKLPVQQNQDHSLMTSMFQLITLILSFLTNLLCTFQL
jgi:hypothetical protein